MYLFRLQPNHHVGWRLGDLRANKAFHVLLLWKGMCKIHGSSTLYLATLSASSFPRIFVCALFFLYLFCVGSFFIVCMMCAMRSLLDGCVVRIGL